MLVMSFLTLLQIAMESDVVLAIAIFAGSVILSRVIHFIFQHYVKRLADQTKTDVDDIIIKTVEKPLEHLVILGGLYFSLISLNFLFRYTEVITEVFFVFLVVWCALVLQQLFSSFVPRWIFVRHEEHKKSPELVAKVLNIVVYIIAFLIILDHFHVEITPIIATLGIGGLAVGLALQDSLSNFFAGLYIVSGSPIKVGDFIELPADNVSGFVEDISWRATKLRTLPNTIVIVPNSKLSQSLLVNTYLPDKEMAVLVNCGVAYDSDLEKVEKVTVEVAAQIQKNVPGAVKTFIPFIRYNTFADSNINFTVILRGEEYTTKYLITHEFIKALKSRFDREGIEISFPVRKVYTVPASKKKR